jgi:hypothetical protein
MGQPVAKMPPPARGPVYHYAPSPNQKIENFEIYMGDQRRVAPQRRPFPSDPTMVQRPQSNMMSDLWEEEPVYLPGTEPAPRRGLRERFDPFEYERDMRPQRSVARDRGLAGDMIENMRTQPRQQVIEPGRVTQYRAAPGQMRQPRMVKQTHVVNEPRGYMPPNNGQPNINFGNPPSFLQQGGPNSMYYDPSSAGNPMSQMGHMGQMGQMGGGQQYMTQPVVIPGSLYSPASGLQKI